MREAREASMDRRLPPKRSSSQEVDAPREKFWEVELRKPLSGDRLHPALASAEGSRDAWETRSFSLASRMRSKATFMSGLLLREVETRRLSWGSPKIFHQERKSLSELWGGLFASHVAGRSLVGVRKSGPTMQEPRKQAARRGRCLNVDDMEK
jgi:hypothetical protein